MAGAISPNLMLATVTRYTVFWPEIDVDSRVLIMHKYTIVRKFYILLKVYDSLVGVY
jgi:hypothetical protein